MARQIAASLLILVVTLVMAVLLALLALADFAALIAFWVYGSLRQSGDLFIALSRASLTRWRRALSKLHTPTE